MLVLSRKVNETIHIGNDIEVRVVKIRGNVVGLGIVAPRDVKVMRNELLDSPEKQPKLRFENPNCSELLQIVGA